MVVANLEHAPMTRRHRKLGHTLPETLVSAIELAALFPLPGEGTSRVAGKPRNLSSTLSAWLAEGLRLRAINHATHPADPEVSRLGHDWTATIVKSAEVGRWLLAELAADPMFLLVPTGATGPDGRPLWAPAARVEPGSTDRFDGEIVQHAGCFWTFARGAAASRSADELIEGGRLSELLRGSAE